MSIRQLSKRDIRECLDILEQFGLSSVVAKVKRGVEVSLKKGSLIYLESKPLLVKKDSYIVPYIEVVPLSNVKRVYVDRGAVKPITNGADVMAPGIVKFDDFGEGDVVGVFLEGTNSVLAVGIALINSERLKDVKKGKVIKNLHYLSDVFWNYVKSSSSR